LNTCYKETSANYRNFYDFIKSETNKIGQQVNQYDFSGLLNTFNNNNNSCSSSSLNEDNFDNFEIKETIDLQCLCEISNIIGFDRRLATQLYNYMGTTSIYRNLEIKSNCKLRPKQLYVSNVFSVIANCGLDKMNNIYTQGSPDLVFGRSWKFSFKIISNLQFYS
jgi:hypothetical protein